MDALTLLIRARVAGLKVRADGDRLTVHGPQIAEALALEILANKTAVLQLVRAWTDDTANDLLQNEIASLARMAPPSWRSTDPERAEINAAEHTIATAFYDQDFTCLYRALRDYRWAIFRSWRRHNAAGRPTTEEVL